MGFKQALLGSAREHVNSPDSLVARVKRLNDSPHFVTRQLLHLCHYTGTPVSLWKAFLDGTS